MIVGTAGTELAKSGFEGQYPVGRGTPVYAIVPFQAYGNPLAFAVRELNVSDVLHRGVVRSPGKSWNTRFQGLLTRSESSGRGVARRAAEAVRAHEQCRVTASLRGWEGGVERSQPSKSWD